MTHRLDVTINKDVLMELYISTDLPAAAITRDTSPKVFSSIWAGSVYGRDSGRDPALRVRKICPSIAHQARCLPTLFDREHVCTL